MSSEKRELEGRKAARPTRIVNRSFSNLAFQKPLQARSISKTVITTICSAPFQGQVLSCFPGVCNLADDTGRVVSLVTDDVGDGPLNVVVDAESPFAGLEAGVQARINGEKATVGDRLAVDLREAETWNPFVTWGGFTAAAMATLWGHVQEQAAPKSLLTIWVPAIRLLGGAHMAFQEMARDAAERLLLALRRGDGTSATAYATALAGLGPGSTPAGDDYLIGLMAGLHAWPQFLAPGGLPSDDACALIFRAAAIRTHVFSRAHLKAAQIGQMSAGWHRLADALAINDETAIQQAADDLLAVGATSGADAMAGFLGPYLLTSLSEG